MTDKEKVTKMAGKPLDSLMPKDFCGSCLVRCQKTVAVRALRNIPSCNGAMTIRKGEILTPWLAREENLGWVIYARGHILWWPLRHFEIVENSTLA